MLQVLIDPRNCLNHGRTTQTKRSKFDLCVDHDLNSLFFSLLISLTHHFIKVTFWYPANTVSIDWSNTLEENYNFYYVMQLRAGLLVWERWVGEGGRGQVTGGPNLPTSYALHPQLLLIFYFVICFLPAPCFHCKKLGIVAKFSHF